MSNSNADETPPKHTTRSPPQPSLSTLPDDIVLRCLVRVPRSYHLNISWVSKHLRALVRSPELNRLRSHNKSSLYVCFREKYYDPNAHWFILRPNDYETPTTEEYQLVPNPTPFPSHPNYRSSTVAVGSKIFFIGGSREPSTDLWILDTRSGNMTQGPSMSVPREKGGLAVGVIDGKIYVIGGGYPEESSHQVEVFDLKSETWELAGVENVGKTFRCGASVEGKVYMLDYEETSVYNPREGEGERLVHMVSQRLSKHGRTDTINDTVDCVCVVEDVLFAFVRWNGVMWFDTKLSVWRKLVGRDGKKLASFVLHDTAMAEHDGRLVVLYSDIIPKDGLLNEVDNTFSMDVQCLLVSLHRSGDRICGTVDWSGAVATVPYSFRFLHCLAVSE